MTDCFSFSRGKSPLLISVPHDGRELAPGMEARMTEAGLALTDTDWHVRRLYEFAESKGAGIISANYSRYVVDLNRADSDELLYPGQLSTGLCPAKTFDGRDIYLDGEDVGPAERQQRVEKYWRPYHEKIETELAKLKEQFGYALLWDAHSIMTNVPGLFEGELPELNIGTNNGASCHPELERVVADAATNSTFSNILNGRFTGGFITRHFGRPRQGLHAIQLELTQHCYMNEATREYDESEAASLTSTVQAMLDGLLNQAAAEF